MTWVDATFLVSDLAFAFGSVGIAGLVLAGGRRWTNALLALFLCLWGLTPRFFLTITPAALAPPDYPERLVVLTNVFGLAILPVYLAFLGCALATPLARPFGRAPVRALLLGLAGAALVSGLWQGQHFANPIGQSSWSTMRAGTRTMVVFLIVSALVGLVLALDALRRAAPGSPTRSRMRAYALAFILFDAGQVIFFLAVSAEGLAGAPEDLVLAAANFVSVAGLALLARALLRQQLFDFDLRLKKGIEKSAIAGAFLVAFLVVAQLVQNYTSTTFGVLGGALAAGLALFALRPIERVAERVADAAMPRVRDTEEYRMVRKREVYRAAVESALEDGQVTERERSVLATLADQLGLGAKEALDIERETRVGGASA